MLRLFRHKQEDPQTVIDTSSRMVAELFGVDPITQPVIFVSPEEIEEMKIKDGQLSARNESYFRNDDTIVIAVPASSAKVLDSESFLYKTLVFELAGIYQRNNGRHHGGVGIELTWLDRARLRSDGVTTLVLPRAMIEEAAVVFGKFASVGVYCQLHVLNALRKHKATKTVAEETEKWPEVIKDYLDAIKELADEYGNFDQVRSNFKPKFKNITSIHGLLRHPDFIRIKPFYNLSDTFGYWLANSYLELIGNDRERFREFARTPIFPITRHDIMLVEQSLQKLNSYLTANNSLALGYHQMY